MKKHIKILAILSIVAVFGVSFFVADNVSAQTNEQIIQQLQEQIKQLKAQIADLQAQLGIVSPSKPEPVPVSTSTSVLHECPVFSHTLYRGVSDASTGGEVIKLQKMLAKDSSVYPEGLVTGYYGPLTEKAVQRWQAKHGVVSSGSPTTTGYGVVGPQTRTKISVVCPTPIPEPIPSSTGAAQIIVKKVGEREGSFLIQKINIDSVDGLWYRKYPMPIDVGSPKTIRIGDDIGYDCEGVSEKLTNIDFSGQTVTFTKVVSNPPLAGCPICLAYNTLIDTPSGPVPVQDIHVGMSVWTVDGNGHRVAGVVMKNSKVSAPVTHQVVHLLLDDGRELFVSPGHPTIDGRTTGDLASGNLYDGARVLSAELVAYDDTATYDILPSGETGFYWANSILLGSTLR